MSTVEEARPVAPESMTVGDAMALRRDAAGALVASCAECGHELGPADRDPKLGAVMRELSIADLSPLNAEGMTERLVARHFHCPSCALLLAVNVQQVGDPVMLEWRLDPGTGEPGADGAAGASA